VEYKAQTTGIRASYVEPAYTSKTYALCGNLGKRKKTSLLLSFLWQACPRRPQRCSEYRKPWFCFYRANGAVNRPNVAAHGL